MSNGRSERQPACYSFEEMPNIPDKIRPPRRLNQLQIAVLPVSTIGSQEFCKGFLCLLTIKRTGSSGSTTVRRLRSPGCPLQIQTSAERNLDSSGIRRSHQSNRVSWLFAFCCFGGGLQFGESPSSKHTYQIQKLTASCEPRTAPSFEWGDVTLKSDPDSHQKGRPPPQTF